MTSTLPRPETADLARIVETALAAAAPPGANERTPEGRDGDLVACARALLMTAVER
jgi:hypothetical protein